MKDWLFMQQVFPETSKWVEETQSEGRRKRYKEYRHIVFYHYARANDAEEGCNKALRNYTFDPLLPLVNITRFDPSMLVVHGDTAVREAASAIDTGLILTSHVLGLDIEPTKVRWTPIRKVPKSGLMRKRVFDLPESDEKQALIAAVDAVFRSAGYELFLNQYRNWVTHRGAPSMVIPDDIYGQHMILPNESQGQHQAPSAARSPTTGEHKCGRW